MTKRKKNLKKILIPKKINSEIEKYPMVSCEWFDIISNSSWSSRFAHMTGNMAYTAIYHAVLHLKIRLFNTTFYPEDTMSENHADAHNDGQLSVWRFILHCTEDGGLQRWLGKRLLASFDAAGTFFVQSSIAAGRGFLNGIQVEHGTKKAAVACVSLVLSVALDYETPAAFILRFTTAIHSAYDAVKKGACECEPGQQFLGV